LFIAAGSWAINRIGAAQTAMLIIAGQMISGVLLDVVMGAPGQLWARLLGVALILSGIIVTQGAKARK
jgi:transporter family-2 protein